MKYPFTYVIVYYEHDAETKKNKYFREAGIGFADSYSQAASLLEETFGNDLVRIINIFLMEGGDLMRLPEEYIRAIENETFEPIECDADGRSITDDKKWEIKRFKQAVMNSRSNKADSD